MKLFSLKFSTLILRFYLLMAIVIGAFFIGYPILAVLALPVFFTSMMGMKFAIPGLWQAKKHTAPGAMAKEPKHTLKRAHHPAHQ